MCTYKLKYIYNISVIWTTLVANWIPGSGSGCSSTWHWGWITWGTHSLQVPIPSDLAEEVMLIHGRRDLRGEIFYSRTYPLEHCPIPGQIGPDLCGLLKEPEDVALLSGMLIWWWYGVYKVVILLQNWMCSPTDCMVFNICMISVVFWLFLWGWVSYFFVLFFVFLTL